jgi:alkane 1-monooxygenase
MKTTDSQSTELGVECSAMGRFFAAYFIPLSAAIGLWLGGAWAWLTVVFVYGLVPVVDRWVGGDTRNLEGEALVAARASRTADWALYVALPVQLGLFWGLAGAWQGEAGVLERAGWVLSTALACGGLGIVIGHELVHRRDRREYWVGKLLLGTVLYMHFAIEHVRGHHARVATDDDPASARRGQTVYGFIPGSVLRQFASAWALEAERLARTGRGPWTWRNEMLVGLALQVAWLAAVALAFGREVMAVFIAVAALAVGLLEVVNYIEHYGLRRRRDATGRLEPVRAHHSWNSDHVVSRALLFELPRHTDHNINGGRPYQTLRSVAGAPQLPAGYPMMVLMALWPPLWFRVMDPRVAAVSAPQ